jgi:hypothetical protein
VSGLQCGAVNSRSHDDAAVCSTSGDITRRAGPVVDDSTRPTITDREPESRAFEQLDVPRNYDLYDVLEST